jgi:acyl-CoA thioesterase-1
MTGAQGNKQNRRRFGVHFTVLCFLAMGAGALSFDSVAQSAPAARAPRVVLVVGDSLSAEYGLQRGTGWVGLLAKQVSGMAGVEVVNASVSGDTSSGGRSRLPSLLQQHHPTHVIIELGGNDALRGLPLSMTQANLQAMAQAAKASGAKVLLVGMQVPPNYGRQYSDDFAALFAKVAKAEATPWVPFLLKGVADVPEAATLFQADRIHPNEKAQARMMENVWPVLKPML